MVRIQNLNQPNLIIKQKRSLLTKKGRLISLERRDRMIFSERRLTMQMRWLRCWETKGQFRMVVDLYQTPRELTPRARASKL